jgi:prepilin-type N-terminal cleavage/methylation domain-containing protein/prepilin-type processing-associated H-X9-DG protein
MKLFASILESLCALALGNVVNGPVGQSMLGVIRTFSAMKTHPIKAGTSATQLAALPQHTGCRKPAAFTLLELLVVLCVLALLVSIIIPGQARAQPGGQALQCLNNLRQLMGASSLYCADNRDALPMVLHGGYVPSGAGDPNKPWVTGWLDWTTSTDNTNVTYLLDPRYASLAGYFARDKRIYKCPADVYVSPTQRALRWEERARSVSANVYVGKGNAWASSAGGPSGPNNLTIYRGAAKAADLLIPGPAQTWVYIDEHPDSMNDSGIFPPSARTTMPDAPATYHNGAAGVALADGHCEIHRWTGPTMNKPRRLSGLAGVSFADYNNFATVQGDPDLLWLSYGSPRWSTRTVAD